MRRAITLAAVGAGLAAAALGNADARGVDPRANGFEVAMGEWTLVPEAKAIRPGEVTFVVTNRGKVPHRFRIRSAGDRGRDRFEIRSRTLRAGETARITVRLAAGVYDLECSVEDGHGDHEDLGMHARLDVRADAPLVAAAAPASSTTVQIQAFAFKPATLTVKRGTTVRWVNRDAAPHTVTATSGASGSNELRQGGVYTRRFAQAGTFAYLCALHPQMKGRVVVR